MKPKITGISSEDYPGGRIDKVNIDMQENLQGPIMASFKELGFTKEDINDLDIDYPSTRGYFFIYSKKIKAHFFIEKSQISLVFDSSINKKNLMDILEKYFQLF